MSHLYPVRDKAAVPSARRTAICEGWAASGRQLTFDSPDFKRSERRLYPGDFKRSMQHLSSNYRGEDVADEAKTEGLLQLRAEEVDVGSLAGW